MYKPAGFFSEFLVYRAKSFRVSSLGYGFGASDLGC